MEPWKTGRVEHGGSSAAITAVGTRDGRRLVLSAGHLFGRSPGLGAEARVSADGSSWDGKLVFAAHSLIAPGSADGLIHTAVADISVVEIDDSSALPGWERTPVGELPKARDRLQAPWLSGSPRASKVRLASEGPTRIHYLGSSGQPYTCDHARTIEALHGGRFGPGDPGSLVFKGGVARFVLLAVSDDLDSSDRPRAASARDRYTTADSNRPRGRSSTVPASKAEPMTKAMPQGMSWPSVEGP